MMQKNQPAQQPSNTYQTGYTAPPKNHSSIIAILLSATILICSVSTVLSLMRINLLQKVVAQTEKQKCTMAFATPEATVMALEEDNCLQIDGHSLNAFWQSYRQLPQGLYVSQAYGQPLRSGDIILSLEQIPVTDWEMLSELLAEYETGDCVTVLIQRDGKQLQLELTIYD